MSTAGACTYDYVRTEAWIDGIAQGSETCSSNVWSNGACITLANSSNGGSAQSVVSSGNWGQWTGVSNHWQVISGTWYSIDQGAETTLNAGTPTAEEQCQMDGGFWDPDAQECSYQDGSPILIATGPSQSIVLTSPQDGVLFDIYANGVPEKVAWTTPNEDVAFLCYDRNGNGVIDDASELFGNHTLPGAINGFIALQQLAAQMNNGYVGGYLDVDDPLYSHLLLWTDRNHDGISQPDELRPFSDLFSKMGVGYGVAMRRDGNGNLFRFRGWAELRTGPGKNQAATALEHMSRTIHSVYDVFFAVDR